MRIDVKLYSKVYRNVEVKIIHRINNDGLSFVPLVDNFELKHINGWKTFELMRLSLIYNTYIISDGMSKYICEIKDLK